MRLIVGRGGELINPGEYPADWWARVGERLDAIAAEPDDVHAMEAAS